VAGAPAEFAELEAGSGIRRPLAIVHHINGVLGYGREVLATGRADYRHHHPRLEWRGEVEQVHRTLAGIDEILVAWQQPEPGKTGSDGEARDRLRRLLQGPLSDAMTHVGQLALLRRVAGAPLPSENFYLADISAGRLGEDQAAPVSPDEE
jgi:hypothetical protein